MDFITGGLAAAGASVFSNPFDVIKTRLQLQGELRARGQHAVYYRNAFHAGYVVAKNEGIRGLQKGLSTALVLHGVRNSVRLGCYQWLERNGYLTDKEGRTIFIRSFCAGALSGAAGAFFGSPLFLVKTQLQSQAAEQIAVGTQHKHKSAVQAMRTIFEKQGIAGLWRGTSGTVLRAFAGSSAQLTSFAKAKDVLRDFDILKDSPVIVSFLASIFGGVIQTIVITPFDLVSTRLYNQGVDAKGRGLFYSGVVDCFVKIWRSEGILAFYKGVGANYLRLAPHGALCLVFWDTLKNIQHKYIIVEQNVNLPLK